ncbi:alpha/beta hydrolase fold domain-containing protein [Leucobacter aridicollis]|uniref:alpha/beta hydrolase fold domain-containing protein n=1 Tax=Leucobacter aridicollis TaxID=283878 RepID=UPI0021056F1A|nr:alpha/beta hydrolase fold domain-containing protein [Leucobacter aridicollis]UTX54295.1 alpha/beta hydrolase fold domain-containing protein [Leucobacter aridicollis]
MQSFADIPAHVRSALTPQMRRVVTHQLDRLAQQRNVAAALNDEYGAADGIHGPVGPRDPAEDLAAARSEYLAEREFWNAGGPAMHETQEHTFDVAGARVRARLHRPTDSPALPAIVYLHGGGFRLGNLDSHDRIARVLAAESGAAVVAVDYSLSPEARFPQALLECAGVVAHLALSGDRYGIDGEHLAVAGDSAGAMLALGTALLLRDEPSRVPEAAADPDRVTASLKAMLLYYGGYGLEDSPSRKSFGGFWDGMSSDDLALIHSTYLTGPADRESPYATPLSADLEASLPPTFVLGAELDPLRDDTEALGRRLAAAGHDVHWAITPGVLHSFLHFGRMLDAATAAMRDGAAFAKTRLAHRCPAARSTSPSASPDR